MEKFTKVFVKYAINAILGDGPTDLARLRGAAKAAGVYLPDLTYEMRLDVQVDENGQIFDGNVQALRAMLRKATS